MADVRSNEVSQKCPPVTTPKKNSGLEAEFSCPSCSISMKTKAQFLRHIGSEHGNSLFASCKTCSQYFSADEITSHVLRCKGSYSCVYCRHTFALPSYLKRHIRRKHSTIARHSCKFCGNTFSSSFSLNVHIQKHFKSNSNLCDLCGSLFTSENQCQICDAISKSSRNLSACHVCGRHMNHGSSTSFSTGEDVVNGKGDCILNRIMDYSESDVLSLFHQVTKFPPYTCPYCNRVYVSTTYFRKHVASHAPYLTSKNCHNFEDQLTSKLDDLFTEQDWLDAEALTSPDSSPNFGLLHSILYDGSSEEL